MFGADCIRGERLAGARIIAILFESIVAGRRKGRAMRVVVLPAPALPHAFSMVPLAWAFRSAGHEVVFVAGGDALAVANAGLPVVDALPGRTTSEMLVEFMRDLPELYEPLGEQPLRTLSERKALHLAAWDRYVDPHVRLAEQLRPDLVLYDSIFGVGAIVSAKLGIPAIAQSIALTRYSPDLLRDLPGAMSLRRYGLTLPEGIPTVDIAPPSVVEGPPGDFAMRFVPYNGGSVLPDWVLAQPDRPRIAVTFGSLDATRQLVRYVDRVAAVAAEVDAEFVVTLAEQGGSPPVDVPANVRITRWVPMNALLGTCSAAVHHGGATSLTCCAVGIPQLVLPGPETAGEAELLRRRGVARVLRDVDSELDTVAIRALLNDEGLHRAAAEVRAEIADLPTPSDLLPRLLEHCRSTSRHGRTAA
jgi:UDP:flavonoid glycosyltransferase YjiC (YdhE family)